MSVYLREDNLGFDPGIFRKAGAAAGLSARMASP